MSAPGSAIRFTKMSGAGNDFIVLEAQEAIGLGDGFETWVRRVCRRGLSVGADGVIVVRPVPYGRVEMIFHNPDGSAAFCGNGTRCAARYAHARGWVADTAIVSTLAGDIPAELLGEGVRLTLQPPRDHGRVTVEIRGHSVTGRHVDAGAPHFVVPVGDLAAAPVQEQGRLLRRHSRFGEEGVNVDFVAWRRDGSLGIRTFERGVEGETLCCGSGAVAAAFAAHRDGGGSRVRVVPWSDVALHVTFPGPEEAPFAAVLEGDARFVYEGTLHAEGVSGFPTS